MVTRHGDRGMWRKLTKDTLIFDWSKFHPRAAFQCVPAIAVPLAVGLSTGHARQGVLAAAGAFSVGFGSFQQFPHSPPPPILPPPRAISISTWLTALPR